MYKIFINNTPLLLTENLSDPEVVDALKNFPENTLLLNWDEIPQMIQYAIEVMENNNDLDYVVLFGNNLEKLKNAFWSFYQYIEAAGGLVWNEKKELLMIFRNNKWDLPKGKIEPGENKNQSALREVSEETGLQNLEIIKELLPSFHTYKINENRILKCTFWFEMKVFASTSLILQKEENITDAKWVKKENFAEYSSNTYTSIREMIVSL